MALLLKVCVCACECVSVCVYGSCRTGVSGSGVSRRNIPAGWQQTDRGETERERERKRERERGRGRGRARAREEEAREREHLYGRVGRMQLLRVGV